MTEPITQGNFSIDTLRVTFNGSNARVNVLPRDLQGLQYSEGLLHQFINVNISILDSTNGLSDVLFGMEKWEIKFTDTFNNVTYDFTDGSENGPLYCYKISNKAINDNTKTFTLQLCRYDAILNMQKRVCKKYTNIRSNELLTDIIKNELKSDKKLLGFAGDNSTNGLSFIPPNSRPLEILIWAKNKYYTNPKNGSFSSAGYFFYENYRGYHYEPIDTIADNDRNPLKGRYNVTTTTGGTDEIFTLQSVEFKSNIDMISNFNNGVYSGKIEFFDINSGRMTTRHYSLKDYYPNWNKVTEEGGLNVLNSLPLQDDLKPNISEDKEAIEYDYGSRTMFVAFNKGLFSYNDPDGNVQEDSAGFINAVSQSVSRSGLFTNQVLQATSIYGNMGINAGNHIEVNFFDSQGNVDKGHSGRYVVFSIQHVYIESDRKFKTNYTLVRDSFGI